MYNQFWETLNELFDVQVISRVAVVEDLIWDRDAGSLKLGKDIVAEVPGRRLPPGPTEVCAGESVSRQSENKAIEG